MKQRLLQKTLLLLFALIAGSSSVWADTYTMSMDSGTKNGTKNVHWTSNNATLTHSNVSWSASFSGGSITNSNNYVQIGSQNSPFTTITLSTSGISGTITEIKVGCGAYQSNATVAVTVGGNAFGGNAQSVGAAPPTSGPCNQNTFSGSASGEIVITITNGSNGRAGYIDYVSVTYSTASTCATPTFDPAAGAYTSAQNVTISTTTEGATIYYTTDGSTPTTSSSVYSSAIPVSTTTTIKAMAVKANYENSSIATATYSFPVTYNLVTSIVPGKHYIIVGEDNAYKAMGTQKNNNRAAVAVTVDNGSITLSGDHGVCEFVIYGPDANGRYSIYDGNEDGYLYAASSGNNYLKTQETNNIDGKWNITFDGDVASIVADGSSNRNVMRYNSSSSLFSCYASASQNDVYLYEKAGEATPTVDVTITTAEYATFCSPVALDFGAEDIRAYKVNVEGGVAKFTEVEGGKVPAYTGVVLYKSGGTSVAVSVTNSPSTPFGANELVGVTEEEAIEYNPTSGVYNYILQVDGEGNLVFRKATGAKLRANRAYLSTSVSSARELEVSFGDETAINALENSNKVNDGVIYDLSGRRVDNPTKGIYIMNGKKFVVK